MLYDIRYSVLNSLHCYTPMFCVRILCMFRTCYAFCGVETCVPGIVDIHVYMFNVVASFLYVYRARIECVFIHLHI